MRILILIFFLISIGIVYGDDGGDGGGSGTVTKVITIVKDITGYVQKEIDDFSSKLYSAVTKTIDSILTDTLKSVVNIPVQLMSNMLKGVTGFGYWVYSIAEYISTASGVFSPIVMTLFIFLVGVFLIGLVKFIMGLIIPT